MTSDTRSPAVAQLGDRLREARLNARLTVREAAERAGLRAHGTLVQYENGRVLPQLDRRPPWQRPTTCPSRVLWCPTTCSRRW
jgi:DNA-binding XRE family transcriptional regulator